MGLNDTYLYYNARQLSTTGQLKTIIQNITEDNGIIHSMATDMVNMIHTNSIAFMDNSFSTALDLMNTTADNTVDVISNLNRLNMNVTAADYTAFENYIQTTALPHITSSGFASVAWSSIFSGLVTDVSGSLAAGSGGWYLLSSENFDSFQQFFSLQREQVVTMISRTRYYISQFAGITDTNNFVRLYMAGKMQALLTIQTALTAIMNSINTCSQSLHTGVMVSATQLNAIQTGLVELVSGINAYTKANTAFFSNTNTSLYTYVSSTKKRNVLLQNDPAMANIYADERPPEVDSVNNGWAFKNSSARYKINWYFLTNPSDSTYLISSAPSFYFIINAANTVSLPFVVIYSKNSAGTYWYGTKKVFTNYAPAVTTGTKTLVYIGTDPTTLTGISDQIGAFDAKCALTFDSTGGTTTFVSRQGHTDLPPTDVMYMTAIGTDSSAAVNNVNFSLLEVGWLRTDATTTMATISVTRSTMQSLTIHN
jgi:hypothetical protein